MSSLMDDVPVMRLVWEALEFSSDGKEPSSLRPSIQTPRRAKYTPFSTAAQHLFQWIGFQTRIIYFCPTLSAWGSYFSFPLFFSFSPAHRIIHSRALSLSSSWCLSPAFRTVSDLLLGLMINVESEMSTDFVLICTFTFKAINRLNKISP